MATSQGKIEISDSEDEPMTSSLDKLSAAALAPPQDAQNAHQAHAKHVGIAVSDHAEGLHVDQDNASKNVDATKVDHINVPSNTTPQEGTTAEAKKFGLEPEAEMNRDAPCDEALKEDSSNSALRDPDEQASAEAMLEALPISQAVPQAHAKTLIAEQNTAEPLNFATNHFELSKKPETRFAELHDPTSKAETASQELNPPRPERVDEIEMKTAACDTAMAIDVSDHHSIDQVQSSNVHNANQPAPQNNDHAHTPEEHPSGELAPTALRPTPPKTPQEITLAELKAQKAALLASLATLPAIQVLMEETASSQAELSDGDGEPTDTDIMAAANKIVKDHIKLLHEYNELKDVGQGLMGLIADQRGVRIVEVQDEFGIDAKD